MQQVEQNRNYEVDDIILCEDTYVLSAVTITGKRPPVKVEAGKMTINLSSALLSTDGNILDALKKLPEVRVQNDGVIILNGKSGVNVLIDDKVTYLSGENLINYLRSIPTESVETIELISQPSADHGLSMTYARRIVRPNYRNMNPFIEVRDQFYMNKGIQT